MAHGPGTIADDLEGTELALHDAIETTEQALRYNRFDAVRADALALLGGSSSLDPESDDFRVLCRRLLDANLVAQWAELRARQGQPFARPAGAPSASVSAAPVTADDIASGPLLSEAFAKFNEAEGARKSWRPKTRGDHAHVQRILLEFLGDRPVGSIRKDDLLGWYAMIRQIPAQRGREFEGMTVPQIVEAAQGREVARLSDKSINARYLSVAKAFFSYATKVDWVEKSPAVVLEPVKVTAAGGDRAFSRVELAKIFGSLKGAAEQARRPGYYWLALLALHSGARLDEVAGLRVKDVREIEGVWCMVFTEAGGRGLKNSHSARTVPVHPRVLALGFLKYLKAQTGERLVPNLVVSRLGKFGGPVGAWFNGYLERIGVKTSRAQTFHSLRHTWATFGARAGIPDADLDELGGWAKQGSQRRKTYTADHTIPQRFEFIKRLDFGV